MRSYNRLIWTERSYFLYIRCYELHIYIYNVIIYIHIVRCSDSIIFLCVLFCRLLLRNHILSNLCLVLSWNLLPQKVLTDLIELCHIGEIVVMWSGYFGSIIYIYMLFCDVSFYYDVLLFTFFSSGIGGYWMAQYKYTVCLVLYMIIRVVLFIIIYIYIYFYFAVNIYKCCFL